MAVRLASFRGVEFHVDTHDLDAGRRGQTHVYPGRDTSYREDLGRAPRGFSVQGFVIGDDFAAKRDAVLGACEAEGPGQLVHPDYGAMQVSCLSVRVSSSSRSGRSVDLSFVFEEGGELKFPSADADSRTKIESLSLESESKSLSGLLARYDVSGFPEFVGGSVAGVGARFLDDIEAAVSTSEFRDYFDAFKAGLPTYVFDALSLGSGIIDIIRGLRTGMTDTSDAILLGDVRPALARTSLVGLTSFGAEVPDVPRETPSRIQESVNMESFASLVRRVALSEDARELVVTPFDSNVAAISAMSEYSERIDAELFAADLGDDEYIAMSNMHAAVVQDLTTRAGGLPVIRSVRVAEPTPALVLAYDLYEDSNRADDIVARNAVAHPGFIAPARDIEVLST
ncbi:MAG: DNA circularization N-terminal domain-containing protein [Parvibaculum sp.]|nr:DNA circularization N-terminal domain-containing protein [Parvibaculum sp.]